MTNRELRKRLRDLKALRARVANEIQDIESRLTLAELGNAPSMRGRKRWPKNFKPPCGTDRGYQWHRYHEPDNWPLPDDDPCGCRAAHTNHERAQAAARRNEDQAA